MHSSFKPICNAADQDIAKAKVAIISDLHIGSSRTQYEKLWNNLRGEFHRGTFNTLVINGDFGDYRESGSEKLTEFLKTKLDEIIGIQPPIHIYILRGNNDTVTSLDALFFHYADMPELKGRFTVGDVLLMGKDAAFIHGDEDLYERERQLYTPQEVRDYWVKKMIGQRERKGNFSEQCTYDEKIMKVDKMLRTCLGEEYEKIRHVFMGHIHPREMIILHQCGGKNYHVTNPPFIDAPSTFIALEFDPNGHAKTPRPMHFNALGQLAEYSFQSEYKAVG